MFNCPVCMWESNMICMIQETTSYWFCDIRVTHRWVGTPPGELSISKASNPVGQQNDVWEWYEQLLKRAKAILQRQKCYIDTEKSAIFAVSVTMLFNNTQLPFPAPIGFISCVLLGFFIRHLWTIFLYTHINTWWYIHIYIYIYIHSYTYKYAYTIHIHIHVHIHKYFHTVCHRAYFVASLTHPAVASLRCWKSWKKKGCTKQFAPPLPRWRRFHRPPWMSLGWWIGTLMLDGRCWEDFWITAIW